MPMRLPDGLPMATAGFDSSEGLYTSSELADLLGAELGTVQRWARAAIVAEAAGRTPRIPVLRTPGGDWRFSARWAREWLERMHGQ
jgi:hypothetical protein